jgi:hypothetical protein
MGMISMARILGRVAKPGDLIAFLVSAFLGIMLARVLPEGSWAIYVSILVFYHLFLTWLVIDANQETGFSLPIASTISTHLACLVIVICAGMVAIRGLGWIATFRSGTVLLVFLGVFGICVGGLATYERDWLFSGAKKKEAPKTPVAAEISNAIAEATAEDAEAWTRYLAQPNRPTWRPGLSVKDEYAQWLIARAKARSAVRSNH